MSTLTGILVWPERSEGRLRPIDDALMGNGAHAGDGLIVPASLRERYPLRNGQELTVEIVERRANRRSGRGGGNHNNNGNGHGSGGGMRSVIDAVLAIEGLSPDDYAARKPFADLTVIDPQPRLKLEHRGCSPSCRLIDLFCPIGRGQRGLIVAPPKAGKTTLLHDIASGLSVNHPEVEVFALLIDERPEEVTQFKRDIPCRVFASSNDHDVERHIGVALMVIERARRMVEAGRHVVILLDSLTRLGRAFNNSRKHASSGRTLSGGIDSRALEVPKQIFGAARNTEDGGSLTILATCLVDTGSQGDQLIFEEFKGTGNMELVLDKKIAEKRIFPAINLAASGTRKEHLLMGDKEFKTIAALRKRLHAMPPHQQVEQLLAALNRFGTNAELVGED